MLFSKEYGTIKILVTLVILLLLYVYHDAKTRDQSQQHYGVPTLTTRIAIEKPKTTQKHSSPLQQTTALPSTSENNTISTQEQPTGEILLKTEQTSTEKKTI